MKNKLDIVIIAVILIGIVINSYLLSQQNNQQETALILLDERINANRNELNTKLDKVNDVALYNREDIRSLEDHVNTELTDILLTLDTHEHDPIYIKEEIVIEPLIEEEIIEEVPAELIDAPLERVFHEETELNIPVPVPLVTVREDKVVEAQCPKASKNLGDYINKVRITRDYKFKISYDVINNSISNVEFSRNLPSNLQRAMIKYLNSFTIYGDTTGCNISIKILEN